MVRHRALVPAARHRGVVVPPGRTVFPAADNPIGARDLSPRVRDGARFLKIVLDTAEEIYPYTSMSAASTTAERPNHPDPSPDPATAPAPTPSRTTRLLGLLRKLIDYGTELARALQQRPALTTLVTIALHFGTRDIALILARIARGLELAYALEDKLVSRPLPETVAKDFLRTPVARKPRTARPAAPRAPLPDLPTAEEIAAALRNRPAGEVIADICRDLGIVPANPLWREIMAVVNEFGGNFVRLFNAVTHRVFAWSTDPSWLANEGWAEVQAQADSLYATGPP